MRRNKRKDFIANINDISLDIALNGEKIFKSEKELKELAEKYKGLIDERVYNALINYDVEEGD